MAKDRSYSAEAIQDRQRDAANASEAKQKARLEKVRPSEPVNAPAPNQPPTSGTPNYSLLAGNNPYTLPAVKQNKIDVTTEWDWRNAKTDPNGNPIETRKFLGLNIKPIGFDPMGNEYFGPGIEGWAKKWAYKVSEERATSEKAKESWSGFWETANQFSKNVTAPVDPNATEEQVQARRQEQSSLFLKGAGELFSSAAKTSEASGVGVVTTPVLRIVNATIGSTLEAFGAVADTLERGMGTQRNMREYATDAGSFLPALTLDDSADEAFDKNTPMYATRADERIGLRSEAMDVAVRLFSPLLQAYDTVRFWTAPGTFEAKRDVIKLGWTEGQMLYTELYKRGVQEEYQKRVQAGEDPDRLAMELQDPWVEAIGEIILDPLNIIGAPSKAGKAALSLSEAAEATKASGALIDIADDLQDIAKARSNAEAAIAMSKIEEKVIATASQTGRALESAQRYKATALTAEGNRFRQIKEKSNYLNNIVQAIRNDGGSVDDVMEYVTALAKRAGGEKELVRQSIATFSHSKFQTLAYNQAAFDAGYMLNQIIGEGDSLIKAIKNTDGTWADLTRILDDKMRKGVDFAFPSIKEMSQAADKAKELSVAGDVVVDPKVQRLADRYKAFVKENPGVAKWAKTQSVLQDIVRPINGALANSYFSLSYGYAFRNFTQNMFTLFIDDGVLFTKEAAVEFTKGGIKTPRLDQALNDILGYIPESLQGKKTLGKTVTEGSFLEKAFGKLNSLGYSPAAIADAAEVYAGKMIYLKKLRSIANDVLKPGAVLPDLASWTKAGMSEGQMGDLVNLLKSTGYNPEKAVTAFIKKHGSGSVDNWRMLDWVNPDAKKGLEEYDNFWNQIVDISNRDGSQAEILDALDEMKIKVRQNALKATNEPVRMDYSDPMWKEISNSKEQAGKFADVADDNKLMSLKIQFDRSAAELNDALNNAAFKLKGDPNAEPLIARIQDFTGNMNRQGLNEVATKQVFERNQWAWDLTKQADNTNAARLWDEAILGPRPYAVDKQTLLDTVWKYYRTERQSVWGGYFEKYIEQASELAKQTGRSELFGKASESLAELQQYRNYVYNNEGIFSKVPDIKVAEIGTVQNANNVRAVANTYGISSIGEAGGANKDKALLSIINKYAPPPSVEKLATEAPIASVQDAIKLPRSELPEDVSVRFEQEARRLLSELSGGEAGKRTAEGSFGSTNVSWYRELYAKGMNRKTVDTALEKIVKDKGADKGISVEKMKDFILDNFRYGDEMNGVPPDLNVLQQLGASDEKMKAALDAYNDITKQNVTLEEAIQQSTSGTARQIAIDTNMPYYDEAGNLVTPSKTPNGKYTRLDDVPPQAAEQAFAKHSGHKPKFFGKDGTPKPVKEGLPVHAPRDPNTSPASHVFVETKQGALDAIEHIKSGIKERWGLKSQTGSNMDALDGLLKDLPEKIAIMKSQAQIVAEKTRDFALLAYGETNNMDFAMSMIYPYQFWYSRSYKNWMTRAFSTNPEIIGRYANLKEALASEQKELPDWWKSQLNVSKMLGIETDNPTYMNLEATLNPLYGLTGADFNSPDKRVNWWTAALDDIGKFGPSVWAPLQWATAAYLYTQGEQEAAALWGGRAIPQTATIKAVSSYFGTPVELDPMIQMFSGDGPLDFKASDPYEKKRIVRALMAMTKEGYSQEELMEVARTQKGEIWDEAYRRAVNSRAPGQLSSFFFGVGFKQRTKADIVTDNFYQDYRKLLGQRDFLPPDQFQDAWDTLREKYEKQGLPMDALLLSGKTGAERDTAFAYNVLGRIPPGEMTDMAATLGVKPYMLQQFYDGKGDLTKMTPQDRDRFMAAVLDLSAMLKMPSGATREEWNSAKETYASMNAELKKKYGDDILDKVSKLYRLPEKDRPAYLEAYPEVQAAMQDKDAYVVNTPIIAAYYGSLDTVERYYTTQVYTQLEQEFGQDIDDIVETYNFLQDNLQTEEAKKFYKEQNLKSYFDRRKELLQEIDDDIINAASQIPEGQGYQIRPEFQAQGGYQEEALSYATTDQQAQTAQMMFAEFSPAAQTLIQESLQTGEELPSAVKKQVKRIAEKYGMSEYEALRLLGVEQ